MRAADLRGVEPAVRTTVASAHARAFAAQPDQLVEHIDHGGPF